MNRIIDESLKAGFLADDASTLTRYALNNSINLLDSQFGEGFAMKHVELLVPVFQETMRATTFNLSLQASENFAEAFLGAIESLVFELQEKG